MTTEPQWYPRKGSGPYEGINGRSSARHVGDYQYSTVAYECGCVIRTVVWFKRDPFDLEMYDNNHETTLCERHAL